MPSSRRFNAALAAVASALFALAAVAASPAAAETDSFGPAVGAPAPHDLALTNQNGAAVTLEAILAEADGGAVVYFSRALSWCPFCIAQAAGVHERLSEFADRGYAVAIVTTDTPEQLAEYAAEHETTAVLLADPDRAAIQAFGIVDPAFVDKKPGSRGYALPYPSAFVIAKDGTVAAKLFEADAYGDAKGYRQRITVDDVLTELDALADAA